jgi:hypothetical protein
MKRCGYFFAVFGTLCVLQSIVSFALKARLVASSPHVTATVVEYLTKSPDGIPVNYPVLEFTTADGHVTRGTLTTGATEPPYAIGDRVKAIYSASDPTRVWVPSVWGLWLNQILMCAMGIIVLTPGVLMLRHKRKKEHGSTSA